MSSFYLFLFFFLVLAYFACLAKFVYVLEYVDFVSADISLTNTWIVFFSRIYFGFGKLQFAVVVHTCTCTRTRIRS